MLLATCWILARDPDHLLEKLAANIVFRHACHGLQAPRLTQSFGARGQEAS